MITQEHLDIIAREAQKAVSLQTIHEVAKEVLATQNNMRELELRRDSLKAEIVSIEAEADKQKAEYDKAVSVRQAEYKARMVQLDYDYDKHKADKEAELMSIQHAYNDEQAKLSAVRAEYEKQHAELKHQVEVTRKELNDLKSDLESLKSKHGIQ
ncbi:MAG: hypothetical protein KGH87_06630 [Thaumarchaeota archaeon]|nr:hypothetical protein [Nitrososphaerota archaeon]